MTEVRPKRGCDVCGGVDDHPRHIVGCSPDHPDAVPSNEVIDLNIENGANGASIRMLMDPTTLCRHMDCCRSHGCPTGECNSAPELQGSALVKAIQKGSE